MILDAHTMSDKKWGWEWKPQDLLKMMDKAGVDRACVMGLWEAPGPDPDCLKRIASIPKKYPRFYPFLRMNPFYGEQALQLLEEAVKKHGIKGLKLHPVTIFATPDNPLTINLVKKAGDLGVPAVIHSGDDPVSLPLHFVKLARSCPNTEIVMYHMGFMFYWEDAINVAKKFRNVYLETSGMPYPQVVKKAVKELGAKKVVYGSDAPGLDMTVEKRKIDIAALNKEEYRLVMGANMARILGVRGGE